MHHGKDDNEIVLFGVDNAVRKTPDLTPTYVVFKDGPSVWKAEYALNCRVNLDRKVVTETRRTTFIVVYGVEKLRLGFGMKCVLHLENRLRALLNTSSPGIGFTFPERSLEAVFLPPPSTLHLCRSLEC
jgi:hypothetical protein